MPNALAIISRAAYGQLGAFEVGDVVAIDRYHSKNPLFDRLAGGALFLVTVRPGDVPWLVAVIEQPRRHGDAVVGDVNRTPLTNISAVMPKIRLHDGNGITAAKGKLAMSLQTPRMLADSDAELLRAAAPAGGNQSRPINVKPPRKRKSTSDTPRLAGGRPTKAAQALIEQVYRSPDDRALRAVVADQLLADHHVWGELISLQLADPSRHADRIDQIVARYANDLVGPITHVAARTDLEFADGFLVACRTAKSRSFTKAPDRMKAARAREWATVRTVTLTAEVPGVFIATLFENPAAANLTAIRWSSGGQSKLVLTRPTADAAWSILPGADPSEVGWVLQELPARELARIATPAKRGLADALDQARAKRAKARAKPKRPRARR